MKNKIRVSFSQIIWRVCNLFMSVFFSLATYVQVNVTVRFEYTECKYIKRSFYAYLFVYLQINDPDAALWMVEIHSHIK